MINVPQPRTSPEGLQGYTPEQLNSIWARLSPGQREYIRLYYDRLRRLNKQAVDAWNKRADRLQYLMAYCEANGYNEFQTRQKIINDWVFVDSSDDWLRFSREAHRCEVAIDMELKMAFLLSEENSAR